MAPVPRRVLGLTAALLAGLAVGSVAAHEEEATSRERVRAGSALSPRPALPAIRPAPDFALPDLDGRIIRLSELRGRVVLLSFIYTRCSSACPLLTNRVALLQRRLGGRPDVQLLTITVDPERDGPEALRRYAARFGADLRTWHFLGESRDRLDPVLTAWDEWARRRPDGEIDHPARLHLIDRRGRVREIYALEFFDERQAWLDVQALLREPA